jgi:Xaa-Pro aminopeptidase
MPPTLNISPAEFTTRAEALMTHLDQQDLSGAVLFDRDYILYYTGFAFIPTERPIALILDRRGETTLFVPRLELEHAQANPVIDHVHAYPEYPHRHHPLSLLADLLASKQVSGRFGVDSDGYPWMFGYRGATLTEVAQGHPQQIRSFIEDQMMIKSPAEVRLIRESVRWANLAHTLLQRYTKPGATETEVSARASQEANLAMLDAIGPVYRAQNTFSSGASAGYRGQIGRAAAIPHALANNITFQEGDILVTGASAPVWGYTSELERTMVIGRPSEEQKRFFDHMLNLQDLALASLEPGLPCAEVDRAVRAYYEEHDLMACWKHHVGHGIGLRYHEGPFLDIGDRTTLKPGMVLTIEPGLYHPGLGGYRHSDTVLITEDGLEFLTYYPRDLETLIIPA